MSTSSDTTAGINATAQQYNDLRADAITEPRRIIFEIKGTLTVADDQVIIPIPDNMVVTKIKHKVTSGSATFKILADSTDVKSGIVAGTSYANETSITNPNITEGQELKIGVTATSSGQNLRGVIYVTYTK